MSPETIEITLRAQEIMADSARLYRQTAENFRLTEEIRKRAEEALLGFEQLLQAGLRSEQTN
jgi:hypothetical protein